MSKLDKFAAQKESSRDSKLEELFGSMPSETEVLVNLPSGGKFYSEKSPQIKINPIKFEDEKQLLSSIKNNINPINVIIEKCSEGVDISELLIIDKLFLLLKIREISYGAEYPASINCPACNQNSEVKIDLSKLLINDIPEDVEDPREILLPKLNKKVKVRFPRVSDETFLQNQEQIYDNIWRFVASVDGISDPVFIAKAIPRMHIMDIKYILKHIMRADLGLNPKFIFLCDKCGQKSDMEVPINENFFSVT